MSTSSQFHKQFTIIFIASCHLPKTNCKCRKAECNTFVQEAAHKMLMKLTPYNLVFGNIDVSPPLTFYNRDSYPRCCCHPYCIC